MITYRKVREDDLELNSKIEELNIKVFPSTETTSDLHFLENYYKGGLTFLGELLQGSIRRLHRYRG